MAGNYPIQLVATSRLPDFDITRVPFGTVFSDHMFCMDYRNGEWRDGRIEPYGPVTIEPGVMMLHYAQGIFEGLKAYRGDDGILRLFRPDMNAKRIVASCERLCIPPLPERDFVDGISALVEVDRDWVPAGQGEALYVRPILYSNEAHLEVRPSDIYRFIVMTGPVGAYFKPGTAGLSLKVDKTYARTAASGGLGACNTAANYSGTLLPGRIAREEGFDQLLWLDGGEHKYVEEAGLMNIFFVIGGRVVTPEANGAILPGVTRDSAITLLREWGIPVEERLVTFDEVSAALGEGAMDEIFVTGTAAVVTPVARIGHEGATMTPGAAPGPLMRKLYDAITGIQYGRIADTRGWTLPVAALDPAGSLQAGTA